MASALNNLQRVDMPLNKEINQPTNQLDMSMQKVEERRKWKNAESMVSC